MQGTGLPPQVTQQRIIFLGDELVGATGDPTRLGWVCRVMARTPEIAEQHVMTLAKPGDTTQALCDRLTTEVVPRIGRGQVDNRLVVCIGDADIRMGLTSARSRLHLANLLDKAAHAGLKCLVVGPPPLRDCDPVLLSRMARACAEVCARRNIPYVDTYNPLINHDRWLTDLEASSGRWPGQEGYGLLAWLVVHRGWVDWVVGPHAPQV